MQTAAIGANTPVSTRDAGLQGLKSEDFFKLLITELQQQDPLQPAKTQDMIGQVSQIRSIELSKQLTDTLDSLTKQQRMTGSSELLGKYVAAETVDAEGNATTVGGIVTGIRFASDGSAVLELDSGQTVRAVDVTLVGGAAPGGGGTATQNPAAAGTGATPPGPTASPKGAAESPLQKLFGEYHRPGWLKKISPF